MRSSKIDGFGRDRSLICCGLLLDRFGLRGFRDRFVSFSLCFRVLFYFLVLFDVCDDRFLQLG